MKNRKELEQRSFVCEVRAEESDAGKIITGRPIVYDSMTNLGPFDEVIERGALTMTDLTDVRFLINHDLSKLPIARSRRNNGNSTMQLSVDEFGMNIVANIDTENNSDARTLYSATQRGDVSGMSFMFSVNEDRWENLESDHPTRHILSIGSVVEVSAVTFPAYSSTTINARSDKALENAQLVLNNARSQQRAKPLENGEDESKNTLELLKEKTKILGGLK